MHINFYWRKHRESLNLEPSVHYKVGLRSTYGVAYFLARLQVAFDRIEQVAFREDFGFQIQADIF